MTDLENALPCTCNASPRPPGRHFGDCPARHRPAVEKLLAEKDAQFTECDACCFRYDAKHTLEDGSYSCPNCGQEAAEAHAEKLAAALRPFATYGKILHGQLASPESVVVALFDTRLTVADFRCATAIWEADDARTALQETAPCKTCGGSGGVCQEKTSDLGWREMIWQDCPDCGEKR